MNATDTGAALMRAILSAPADDAPRLIYADWLDECAGERGEPLPCPRAEFIRAQIERARTPLRPQLRCHVTEWARPTFGGSPFQVVDEQLRGTAALYGAPQCDLTNGGVYDLLAWRRDGGEIQITGAVCEFAYDLNTRGDAVTTTIRFVATGEVDPNAARVKELKARAAHLLARGHEWSRDLAALMDIKPIEDLIWGISDMEDSHGWNLTKYWRYSRGFVNELRCNATRFLLHAPALLWSESQQRPVPATAQPITRVVLHGIPAADDPYMRALAEKQRFDWYPTELAVGQPTARQFALDAFRAEWPGVQFEYAPNIST